ncbi:hypothetical protein KHQ88_04485 [Mycoplasmatota bacterium]|nr:hypothetical protein KHQ88_04485 [Mycoplasmatota bacterium]
MKRIKIYMTLFILIFAFGCQNNNELTDHDITTELQTTLVENTDNMITELPTTLENMTETEL